MKNLLGYSAIAVATLTVLISSSCGKKKSPISPFEPEVTNLADNFQFQATALQNVSTSVTYQWSNSGTSANIDQSCAISAGTAGLTIMDNDGTQVYTGDLTQGGSFTSSQGTSGVWSIRLDIYDVDGTLNFRVQTP